MIHKITSAQNQNIKNTVKLRDKRGRQKSNQFLVEGAREIDRAMRCDFQLKELYFSPHIMSSDSYQVFEKVNNMPVKLFEVDEDCFAKIAVRESSDGLVAVFEQKHLTWNEIKFSECPIIMAVENIEKPGNLGAILRSADGAKVDAVVVLESSLDLFNPNVIRSSLGTIFSVPVIQMSNNDFFNLLEQNKIESYAAALSERSQNYANFDYKKKTAFILGNEANGLSDFWFKKANHLIQIPMFGIADSLNVSVAGAVLAYEGLRQRSL